MLQTPRHPMKRSYSGAITGILWLMLCAAVQAGIRFERLAVERNASQRAINCIFQDRKGYLWFGTDEGLAKYDGYQFTFYKHEPFDPISLSSNMISQIVEDRGGDLWIIAGGQLNRFDRERERFRLYGPGSGQPGHLASEPHVLYLDHYGFIWIGTFSTGLYRYDASADRFIQYLHDPGNDQGPSSDRITALYHGHGGDLWIGTVDGGLNRFDYQSETFTAFFDNPSDDFLDLGPRNIPRNPLLSPIVEDENEMLWVITYGGGLIHFDTRTSNWVQYLHNRRDPHSISNNIVRSIFRDRRGLLWLTTADGGLDVFDPETQNFKKYRSQPGNPLSLQWERLNGLTMAEDSQGNLWLGTRGAGLTMFDRDREIFRHYQHQAENQQSLSDDTISALYIDRSETLWIGTHFGGLNKYSPHKLKFNVYYGNDSGRNSFRKNIIDAIYEDPKSDLWLGTHGEGLIRFDFMTEQVLRRFRHDPDSPDSISDDHIRALMEDDRGELWVGTKNGLNILDRESMAFRHFFNQADDPRGLLSNDVYSLFRDRSGRVWVGTSRGGLHGFNEARGDFDVFDFDPPNVADPQANAVLAVVEEDAGRLWIAHGGVGLHLLDSESGRFETFSHDIDRPGSLSHNQTSSLLKDEQGRIWIGTLGGGLNLWQPATNGFRKFTEKSHGLSSNSVYGILQDGQGRIWLSLGHGLACFHPDEAVFRNYDLADGLLTNSSVGNAFSMSTHGHIFRGGHGGFNRFDPLRLQDNTHRPAVVITAFTKLGEPVPGEIDDGGVVELSYRDNYFTIEYAALDFTDPAKNRYAHMLEEFDKDWKYPEEGRTAEYTNLSGGTYRFKVKASNSDGVWNEIGTSLRIHIRPPFWKTWWFYLLEALAATLVLFAGFALQRKRLQRQKGEALRQLELVRKTEELDYARRVQLSMLPKTNFSDQTMEVYGQMRTATEVGGDYYDFFHLDERRFCLLIGDATGHGFASGLVVGMIKMGAAIWALNGRSDLTGMLRELNLGLKKSVREKNMGMSLGVAVIDLGSSAADLVSAGMPFPYHYQRRKRHLRTLKLKGPPLGFFKNIPTSSESLSLEPGDCLIFLSDGFFERFDPERKMWGGHGMEESLDRICRERTSAAQIAGDLFAGCDRFARGKNQDDDMTALVFCLKDNPRIELER